MFRKSTRYMVFAIIAICLLLCMRWWYLSSGLGARSEVEAQINQLVAEKDTSLILRVADDEKTNQFLLSVPKDAKCERTSDYQGQNPLGAYYYVTVLDDQILDVYIKKETPATGLLHLPTWKLVKIAER